MNNSLWVVDAGSTLPPTAWADNDSSSSTAISPTNGPALETFRYVVSGWLLTSVAVLGILLEVSAIAAMRSCCCCCSGSRMVALNRDAFSPALRFWPLVDIAFLLAAIGMFGIPTLVSSDDAGVNIVKAHVTPYLYFMVHVFRSISVYFAVVVNLERLMLMETPGPVTERRIRKYLLPASVFFCVCFNLPKFFEVRARDDGDGVELTALRLDPAYNIYYVVWAKLVLIEFVPYAAIFLLNCRIILNMSRAASLERRQTKRELDRQLSNRQTEEDANGEVNSVGMNVVVTTERGRCEQKLQVYDIVMKNGSSSHQGTSNSRIYLSSRTESTRSGRGVTVGATSGICPAALMDGNGGDGDPAERMRRRKWNRCKVLTCLCAIVLVLFQAWKIGPDVYEAIMCEDPSLCNVFGSVTARVFVHLAHFLACANPAANFFLYYLPVRRFRVAWMKRFGCAKGGCCKRLAYKLRLRRSRW